MKLKTGFLLIIISIFDYLVIVVSANLFLLFSHDAVESVFYYLSFIISQIIICSIFIILVNRLKRWYLSIDSSNGKVKYSFYFLIVPLVGAILTIIFFALNFGLCQAEFIANFGPFSFQKFFFDIMGYTGILLLYLGSFLFALLRSNAS